MAKASSISLRMTPGELSLGTQLFPAAPFGGVQYDLEKHKRGDNHVLRGQRSLEVVEWERILTSDR